MSVHSSCSVPYNVQCQKYIKTWRYYHHRHCLKRNELRSNCKLHLPEDKLKLYAVCVFVCFFNLSIPLSKWITQPNTPHTNLILCIIMHNIRYKRCACWLLAVHRNFTTLSVVFVYILFRDWLHFFAIFFSSVSCSRYIHNLLF